MAPPRARAKAAARGEDAGAAAMASSSGSVDVVGAAGELSSALTKVAPKLAPSPSSAVAGGAVPALARLYRLSEDQLRAAAAGAPRECQLCGAPRAAASDTSLHLGVDWDVDIAKRSLTPRRCRFLCRPCASLSDLPSLIERLTAAAVSATAASAAAGSKASAGRSVEEAGDLLRHFLSVNGLDAADAHSLQDAVSLANALMVIYKELRPTPAPGPPLSSLLPGAGAGAPAASGAGGKKAKRPAEASADPPAATQAPAAAAADAATGAAKKKRRKSR